MTAAEETTQLVHDLCELVEKGGAFVMEQAPPLVRDIILWGRLWNTAQVVVCVVALVLLLRSMRGIGVRLGKEWSDFETDLPFVTIGAAVRTLGIAFFGVSLYYGARYALLAWFAPRLYILEYVLDKIGGK